VTDWKYPVEGLIYFSFVHYLLIIDFLFNFKLGAPKFGPILLEKLKGKLSDFAKVFFLVLVYYFVLLLFF